MPNFRLSKEPYAVKSEGLKNYLYVKLENHIEREREREKERELSSYFIYFVF